MKPRKFLGLRPRASGYDDADARPAARLPAAHPPLASSKRITYDALSTRLLKTAVVFLCAVNALMWEYYTQSRMMAILWAAIAVAFVVWIVDDMRR